MKGPITEAISFLHKGIINNNSFTVEFFLPIKDIITSQKTDRYSKIPTTKSKGKNEKNLPPTGSNMQGFLPNNLQCHKSYYGTAQDAL